MNFNFRDKQSPSSIASSMATAMHIYPTPHTLLGMYSVPIEFEEAAIHEVLDCLTPRKVGFWGVNIEPYNTINPIINPKNPNMSQSSNGYATKRRLWLFITLRRPLGRCA
jgi:hypothetical protein